ncbi:uncharacterized protein BDV14DRAFT_200505 [Aspergillus stella-maris]|uniref:uncharacterized protein n=1 Tax=Aspergillus stella-maris TaxID=1810926 RepID=UPI003CCD1D54
MDQNTTSAVSQPGVEQNCEDSLPILQEIWSQSGINYDLDPDGDVLFKITCSNECLPAQLKDLEPDLLSGLLTESEESDVDAPQSPASEPLVGQPRADSKPVTEEEHQQLLRIRASSRHLILSSTYFSRMWTGKFREAAELKKGHLLIDTIEIWDVVPFLIVLLAIHGRLRKLPRKVSLRRFTDIVTQIEYYDCHEVIEVFSELWLAHLEQTALPETYGEDALSWLFISWVFKRKKTFEQITRVIIQTSTQEIDADGLPIPGFIIEAMNEKRNTLIEQRLDGLHDLFNRLSTGTYMCKQYLFNWNATSCTHLVLGALTTNLIAMRVFFPKPQQPYDGLSICNIDKHCREKMKASTHQLGQIDLTSSCSLYQRVIVALKSIKEPDFLNPVYFGFEAEDNKDTAQ